MLSSSIYISIAQRNQPCTKQRTTYVPIRVRQRKQTDRLGESQHVVEHLSAACCVLKTNEEIESAWPQELYNHKLLVMREGITFIYFQSQYDTTLLFLFRTYLYDACVRRQGCFVEHGALGILRVVSLHLILDLCPLHSRCFVLFSLLFPCERA